MKSFIKFILSNKSGFFKETDLKAWEDNTDSMFENLSAIDKCAFLMHQSVMLNYLNRTYDNVLPNLLNLFKEDVVKWWLPEIDNLTKNEDDPNIEIYKAAYINISSLLGVNPININAKECCDILATTGSYPVASDVSFYRPYLLFVEKATNVSRSTSIETVSNIDDFKINESVSLPQFNVAKHLLIANYDLIFSSYSFDAKASYEYGTNSLGKGVTSIFSFWRNYNWTGIKLNSVVGVLAMQALELDINAIPKSSLMLGYYDVYRMVVPDWKPNVMTKSNSNRLSSENSYIRRCILFFLMDLRKRFNVELDDSKLLAKFVDTTDEEANKVHEFLNADKASEVSVEAYEAFKKSSFRQFTELDIVKHERVSVRESVNRLINAKNPSKAEAKAIEETMQAAEGDGEGDSDTNEQDESKSKKSQSKSKSRSGQSDEDAIESTLSDIDNIDDDQTPTEDDPTDLDNPQEESDPNNEVQPDEEPNDPAVEPTEGDDGDVDPVDENPTDNTHTQIDDQKQDDEPEFPEMSDTKGVKLKLSEGETLDSVLYRDELEAYVDSIITKPPKYLSVQKLEFLKYVKAYWWDLLTVQSLYDTIKAVVRIPKAIKLK